ncbi:MAG: acyl-CoA dehydrogenase family protein [Deferrisomatales bacterium]|nr:acyl-CoA dehydrogenase family protein [Deferrisomatales bacterium]
MDFSFTREQSEIKTAAREFARGEFTPELADECERNHRFPRELFRKAAELGFVGLNLPETVGGSGLGVFENALVIEEFCKADSGLGMALHLAYLPAKMVKLFGTDAQHQRFLRPLAEGRWVSAVAFTEPDHGSDLTSMNTTLVDDGDGVVLNGTKVFTTNATYADFVVVLAQDDPGARPGRGMTAVLVETDPSSWLGGRLEINELGHKMGLHMTSSGELVFHDLRVPKANILGEKGRGLDVVLGFLDESRIEIAAQSVGNCEGALLKALDYSRRRQQFGRAIIEFQSIGHKVARMWSQVHSAKLMTYYAAWRKDHETAVTAEVTPLFTSMVKHYAPETAKAVIDDAINVFGGYGYFLEQDVERRYRDNRIAEIYEGTVEVQLNNMARLLKKVNLEFVDQTLL